MYPSVTTLPVSVSLECELTDEMQESVSDMGKRLIFAVLNNSRLSNHSVKRDDLRYLLLKLVYNS